MGEKLRRATIAVLLAGTAALLYAAPAQASREPNPTTTTQPNYVPPPKYGQNPHPVLPPEPNPYAGSTPPVVPVVLPEVTAPSDQSGQNAGDNSGRGTAPGDSVLGQTDTAPAAPAAPAPAKGGFVGGVLSRTGANTLPLVRAGLAALSLGAGLLILARRRKAGAPA